MEWSAKPAVSLNRASFVRVRQGTLKQSSSGSGRAFIAGQWPGPPDDPRPKLNYFTYYDLGAFPDDKVVVIKQGDDRIRSFLNTHNMIRINKKWLFVQASEINHTIPAYSFNVTYK